MPTVSMPLRGTAAAWREAARNLLAHRVPPGEVIWRYGDAPPDLFSDAPPRAAKEPAVNIPRSFVDLAATVCWHSDPERFARLYGTLWRLKDRPALMGDSGDTDLAKLRAMEKAVNYDRHKMTAFLRFREVEPGGLRRRFAAWFEPAHYIVEPAAPFFARRFGDMDWVIVTPDLTAIFEGGRIGFAEGQPKPDLPDDAIVDLWAVYFRNIFNPARLKVKAMQTGMPKRYWKNMPEAAQIPGMIATATARARAMQAAAPTRAPARAARITERLRKTEERSMADDLEALRHEATGCARCSLYKNATQVVMGEGPRDASLMVVGEQPGDQEDLVGRPFVGPAGQLFDRFAEEVGLDRRKAFVTNAVKHFKFTPRGKRRIHQRPDAGEVKACRWWIEAERQLVRPKLILAMGATAAASVTGSGSRIGARRGQFEATDDGTPVLLTWHPSYLLRVPNAAAREKAETEFRADLERTRDWLTEHAA